MRLPGKQDITAERYVTKEEQNDILARFEEQPG